MTASPAGLAGVGQGLPPVTSPTAEGNRCKATPETPCSVAGRYHSAVSDRRILGAGWRDLWRIRNAKVQLLQLLLGRRRGGAHHEIFGALVHWKGDHLA